MNTARIDIETDRLGPAAQAPPRIDRRLPVVAALVCVVFACFFLIGRATRTGSGSRSEVPSTLPVASVSAAIPVRLSGVQPLYVATPAARTLHAARRSAPAAERTAPVLTRAPAPVPVSAPAPSAPPPSAPAPSAPAPAPEPTRSFSPAPSEAPHPAAAAPSSGGSSGGGGSPTPSKGNGGSFDSSG